MSIQFVNVSKDFGEIKVLENISLNIENGEFVTFIGESGSGKTAVLKLVNGLLRPDQGIVMVHGQNIETGNIVELRKKIGYAIQNVDLFSHMTVGKNIAYIPVISRLPGWGKQEQKEKVARLLKLVGLTEEYGDRYPSSLSAGQCQRVGIAKALASEPDILLMDDPFGGVDEITRNELQEVILRIHEERQLTILFVTRDIPEALKLSTKIIVLVDGGIQQYGKPSEILENPTSTFIEEFVCRDLSFQPRV